MEYICFIYCELGDRDNNFVSHYKFFDSEDDAIDYGRKQCEILSDYPMGCSFNIYHIVD